jgi:predicted AAA+ superfamily ATPase
MPWHFNTKKRLVKAPKIYIKDSGILHSLMAIDTMDQLLSHNKLGASWEGFAFEQVFRAIGKSSEDVYFWSTHSGAEIDLFWTHGGKNWGVEYKYSDAPKATKSMVVALEDLNLHHIWVVYPGKDRYSLQKNITVLPIKEISGSWDYGPK